MTTTKPTKRHMAHLVVQALYNLPAPPRDDDARVQKKMRFAYDVVLDQYRLAIKVMAPTRTEVLQALTTIMDDEMKGQAKRSNIAAARDILGRAGVPGYRFEDRLDAEDASG